MATKVLAIEISERLIKVCETSMGSGVRKVDACMMFETPQNAVNDGEIKDTEAVASALKENLKKAKNKCNKVVFTISSGRIAIREVTLPPVKENKIKAIVEANAADYFPVDMSKYHITYTLQERTITGDDAGCRLLVMAAPVNILEGYFDVAQKLGLMVQAIDYSGNSQFRMLETQHHEGVVMYVDISGTYSITTVMKKDKLLMQRMFPSGVDDYILAYMSSTGKSEADYLAALNELSSLKITPIYDEPLPDTDHSEYLSRLLGNITRFADYYNSSNWETPIEELVLSGTGACVPGLKEAVTESTGLPITVMQKLEKVSAPNNLTNVLPAYISCLGCAIAPVDFIPERYSKTKKKVSKKKDESISFGVKILVASVVAAAGLSVLSYMIYNNTLNEKLALEKQVNDLAYTETVYNNLLIYNKYKDDLSVLENAIKTPNDNLRQFIDELEKKMPAEINILSANCAKESISMNVTVASKEAAAKAIQQLRSFESIKVIVVGEMAEIADESGYATISFSVSCAYNYEPFVVPPQAP